MIAYDRLSEELSARFGLAPRVRWNEELERAATALGERQGIEGREVARAALVDPSLLREIAEALSVSESYFFRHREQLERVADVVTKRVKRGQPVTVWSAGCCRGEEPYSLALLLDERLSPGAWASIRIVANDMSADAIAKARRRRYLNWSLRSVSPEAKGAHFDRKGTLRLRSEMRERIEFRCATLRAFLAQTPSASIDVILFRNVAIYLLPEALDEIYRGMFRVLRPGGRMVLAPSDPSPVGSDPATFERLGTGTFRRPSSPSALVPPRDGESPPGRPRVAKRPDWRPAATVAVKEAVAMADQGDLTQALLMLTSVSSEHPSYGPARRARAQVLFASCQYAAAVREVELMSLAALDGPAERYLAARSFLEMGKRASAQDQLKRLASELSVSGVRQGPHGEPAFDPALLRSVQDDLEALA